MLENGVTVATVLKLMGHAKPEMTMRYNRVREGALKEAAASLNAVYAPLYKPKTRQIKCGIQGHKCL